MKSEEAVAKPKASPQSLLDSRVPSQAGYGKGKVWKERPPLTPGGEGSSVHLLCAHLPNSPRRLVLGRGQLGMWEDVFSNR